MHRSHVATVNACKMCTPMGAALAFRGVRNAIPFLHGSQGCSTYMRRYIISHFREPVDIASSALGEQHAVFGGAANLKKGLLNVNEKYFPELIGVASTCLTETIGDDLNMITSEFFREIKMKKFPEIVTVSTPSYSGTHIDGWKLATKALVEKFAGKEGKGAKVKRPDTVNIFPSFISSADMRSLRETVISYGLEPIMLPDLSDTLDSGVWENYKPIPEGGTSILDIASTSDSRASMEFGYFGEIRSAGEYLEHKFGVSNNRIISPYGVRGTDRFHEILSRISGKHMPEAYSRERGRLVDALMDSHKYLNNKKVLIYGDEDFVLGITSFAVETGLKPVIAATGANNGALTREMREICAGFSSMPEILEDSDFDTIEKAALKTEPDLIIGNSKGYRIARRFNIPFVRAGFPVHDRFGAQRIMITGYSGALSFLDTIVNCILEEKQSSSRVGYGYL